MTIKMKTLFMCILLIATGFSSRLSASLPKETPEQKQARMQWWTNDRFGMFIHWGLYAMPARHEWVKNREKITNDGYQKYFDLFDPDLYNPAEWAHTAKMAGMKYAVITTKHHEGFCLFDSKYTNYKATNTPAHKDLIREWVNAFRAEGIKIGFYYSLLDWHNPDYTIDSAHPQRQNSDSAYARVNKDRDMRKYREYLKNQVRELLTNYGKIDILWLDFSFPGKYGKGHKDWDSENLLKMVRQLQPGIIVNDRLDLKEVEGGWDFTTPEQYIPAKWVEVNGQRVPWESCQTFSGSWGYYRDEKTWKSPAQLIETLIETVSKGGNLILNVGPTARGCFDDRANERLKAIGKWMKLNSRSIYGCTQAPDEYKCPPNCLYTYNPTTRRLYLHLLSYPTGEITLPEMNTKVKYAQFLHDGSEILFHGKEKYWMAEKSQNNDLLLTLPVVKPNVEIPVIELVLN